MKTNKGGMFNAKIFHKAKKPKQDYSFMYGDGVAWVRDVMIGKGCFGCVFKANLKKAKSRYSTYPSIMAVKSAEASVSCSIQMEKQVMDNLRGCPNVIKCFGEEITDGENRQMVYNLLLEYASGGTLADLIKKSKGKGLPECDVRRYARSIVRGLSHIHGKGYVHCDLKPGNIMLVDNGKNGGFIAKIGDLGLAKRSKQIKKKKKVGNYWRGTPVYFPPEAVIKGVQEQPADIWAVGYIVFEMLTGKPLWFLIQDFGVDEILSHIAGSISREGMSFLKGCLCRTVMRRLTVNMLLDHPFLNGLLEDDVNEVEETQQEIMDINAITSSPLCSDKDDDDDDDCNSNEDNNLRLSSYSNGSNRSNGMLMPWAVIKKHVCQVS